MMRYVQPGTGGELQPSSDRMARHTPVGSWRFGTTAGVAFVASLAMFLVVPAFMQLQADSFRDLYLGRWIVAHGFPHREVFAIANRGGRWVDQQWLSDSIAYGSWKLAGYQCLALLNAGAFAAAYGMLAGLLRWRGASVAVAISFSSFAMVSSFTLVFVRAQILVLPLFVALMWLCLDDAEHDDLRLRTLLLLPLLVLWANMHGSALLGSSLATVYLLYRAGQMVVLHRQRTASLYALLSAVTALTVIATPFGFGVVHYYTAFAGNSAMGAADFEWDPPTFPTLGFFQFVIPLALACTSAIFAWRKGRGVSLIVIGGMALTAVAASLAMRNNVWLGMVAAVVLAESAGGWIPTQPYSTKFLRVLAAAAAVLALIGVGRLASERNARFEILAPKAAVQGTAAYAAAHPCSLVLADILSVSALLWHDPWLAGRVEFDGRIEIYRPRALRRWVAFQAADGPRSLEVARGYGILIASSRSPALVRELSRLPGASVLGRDSHGIGILDAQTAVKSCSRAVARRA
jgi:hypothetical protein